MFKKLLVAYDGSEGAQKALAAGIKLAQIHQAELQAVTVQERLPRYGRTVEVEEEKKYLDERFEKIAAEVRAKVQEAGLEIKLLRSFGHPAQTIVEVAKEGNYDLILVGHSGTSGVWTTLLGSTAERVSRHATCSVLIVR